jgi:hypothetical protein
MTLADKLRPVFVRILFVLHNSARLELEFVVNINFCRALLCKIAKFHKGFKLGRYFLPNLNPS